MEQIDKIRIVIADDHDIYRDGLQLLLSKNPAMELVGEANNGQLLVQLVDELKPDIVLTDLRMPLLSGIEAIRKISKQYPATHCIALSTFDSEQLIVNALEAGAAGYVIKNSQKGEIIDAIMLVMNGEPYYCNSTSQRLIKLISKSYYNPYKNLQSVVFSEKELAIIRLICEEKSSKEIGEDLFMSTRTIEGLRAKILEKMKVKTTAGVAIYAIKNSLYLLE